MTAIGHAIPAIASDALSVLLPRRFGGTFKIAALERRLRQDPTDARRRAEAVAHYSREAHAILGSTEKEALEETLGRAKEHIEVLERTSNDIVFLHHVISHSLGARLFYQLPEVSARCMRRIGFHRQCLKEFDTHSEFEERATPYHLANALTILKGAGCADAARDLYEEAIDLEWKGMKPIKWKSYYQTPAVYIEGLEHRPIWENESRLPLANVLEDHWSEIKDDLSKLPSSQPEPGVLSEAWKRLPGFLKSQSKQVPAYPNLVEETGNGVWDMVQLYSDKTWHEDACRMVPRIAELLKKHLPTTDAPYLHYNSEEVVLFLLAPGSRVRLHNGGSNAPLNLHFGVSGCEGAHMQVADETRSLADGKTICFDDGTDHRVWHDGEEERWVLTVRLMHPQLVREPAKFYSRAFTRRTSFESWDETRMAQLCKTTSNAL